LLKKEVDKILNYKYFIIEIQRVWKVKAKVISVITGATETISDSLRQYLSNMQGKHEIKKIQKKPTYWVLHTRTALSANVKVQNVFHGRNNITWSTDCEYRTAATLYTLETGVVSRS